MCILCTPRPIYWSTYWPTLDRCISQHIGRVSTDMLLDLSVKCQSICRPRCVGRHIDRHIGRASVDMSADNRPICWSICRPRVVVWSSADMSIDRLLTFRRYVTATCVLVTVVCRHNLTWVCCLITTEFAAHDPNVKPSEIFEVDQKRIMGKCIQCITYTSDTDSLSFRLIYHRQSTDIPPTINC